MQQSLAPSDGTRTPFSPSKGATFALAPHQTTSLSASHLCLEGAGCKWNDFLNANPLDISGLGQRKTLAHEKTTFSKCSQQSKQLLAEGVLPACHPSTEKKPDLTLQYTNCSLSAQVFVSPSPLALMTPSYSL